MAMVTGVRSGAYLDVASKDSSLSKLVEEMRRDPQVGLVEQVFRSNATSAKVSIVPRDKSNAKLVFLAGILQDLFDRSLSSGLDAIAYGHQAHEIAWKAGNGCQYPSQLVPLPQDVATPICEDGLPVRVKLSAEDEKEDLCLERGYFWLSAVEASALCPLGKSQFQGAVEDVWKERRQLVGNRVKFGRKSAVGTSLIRAPETVANEDGTLVDFHSRVADAVRAADAGDALILSNERTIGANGADGDYKISIERQGGECNDASPLISLIDSVDAELLLAAGIPPKTVIEGDAVGSFALVTQQMQLLLTRVEGLLRPICDTFYRDVVQIVSLVNTGDANSFSLDFSPLSQRPDDMANEIVKTVITSPQLSPLILSGAVDLPAMLRAAGIPISEDAAERFAKLAQQTATIPAPAPVTQFSGSLAETEQPMKGDQLESLASIVQLATSRSIPVETARAMIEAGFPGLSAKQIDAICKPLDNFSATPPTESVAMSLGTKKGWKFW